MSEAISVINVDKFTAYARQLAQNLGVSLPRVIRSEGASVIRIAAAMEKVATIEGVKDQTAKRTMKSISLGDSKLTINVGVRGELGNMWFTDGRTVTSPKSPNKGQKRFYPMGTYDFGDNTYQPFAQRMNPDTVWNGSNVLFQYGLEIKNRQTQAALKARGITQKSWVEIIQAIPGQTLENTGPKTARINAATLTAISRAGPKRTGFAIESTAGLNYTLACLNTSGIAYRRGGIQKVQAAIRIREAGFRQAVKHNLFDNARATAQRYPGLVSVSES